MAEVEKKPKSKRCTKSCVAFGCSNVASLNSKIAGITFHAFPFSKLEVAKKWERAMHRKDFKATKHSRVCSVHFTPESFDRTGNVVRIRAGAIPTKFDLPGHPKHLKSPTETCHHDWKGAATSLSTVETASAVASTVETASAVASTVETATVLASAVKASNTSSSTVKTAAGTVAGTVRTAAAFASTVKTVKAGDAGSSVVTRSSCDPVVACLPFGNDNTSASVASQATGSAILPYSTFVILQPSKLPACAEHSYSLPSSTELKHQLEMTRAALVGCKSRLKTTQQKNRRLESRLRSLQRLFCNLIENKLISQEAADCIKSNFHFSVD